MKSRLLDLLLLACLIPGSTGCATIISGPKQTLRFRSQPPGATVTVDGHELGRTPLTTKLGRWKGGPVRFEFEGYESRYVSFHREFNLYSLVNIPLFLLGVVPGIVGFGVDGATGAIVEFDPDRLQVTLTPLRSASEGAAMLRTDPDPKEEVRPPTPGKSPEGRREPAQPEKKVPALPPPSG